MCWIFITYFTVTIANKAQEYIKTNSRNMTVVEALVTLTIAFGRTQRPCGNVAASPAPCIVSCVLTVEEHVSLSILPSEHHHLFVITTCAPLINYGHEPAEVMCYTCLLPRLELHCSAGK